MPRFEIQQIDFQGGIAETIKQNANQSGQLTSVLWLSNYNPNLEQHTAVMRPGIVPVTEKTSRLAPTETIIKALLSQLSSQWNEDNVIISSTLIELSNPEYQNAYFLFVKWKPSNDGVNPSTDNLPSDHEMTTEIGESGTEATGIWLFTYDPNDTSLNAEKLWYNSFLPVLNLDYPGWYPFGTLKDWQRWGETILFVTKMSTYEGISSILKKYLYPVYKWTYWNLSKKRELGDDRFWNNLLLDLNKKGYIVESPILSLQQDNQLFEAIEIDKGRLGTDPRKYINIETKQEVTSLTKDITLLFFEKDLAEEVNYFADIRYTVGDSSTRSTPYATMSFLRTFEIPENPLAISEMKTVLTTSYPAWNTIVTSEAKGNHFMYFSNDLWYYGVSALDAATGDPALGFALPNYVDSKMPRLWLEEEKIPYIVTMIINGQEVIINKGTKKIKLATQWQVTLEDGSTITSAEKSRLEQGRDSLDLQIKDYFFVLPIVNKSLRDIEPLSADSPNTFLPKVYPVLYFTLRISQTGHKKLIANNVQAIRIYVSSPHETKSVFRSIGTTFYDTPPPVTYHGPAVDRLDDNEIDYTKFGLVKEFKIEGKGDYIDDYNNYRGELHNTNAWKESLDPIPTPIYSEVQEDGNDYPIVRDLALLDSTFENGLFTPDFILWDYPTDRPTLQLGGSGKYWQGLGAGLILVIKGRSFIGQCIDKDGKEEQSIMRYCAMQGPVMLYGTFYDEHKMYIGHNRHIAFLEFREQALIFSRKDHFRMTLNDISDEETWEINEHYEGHGTFNQKTIISTPYGYIYCNENGIWLSEGAIPRSLTENIELNLNITSLYRMVALGDTYAYISIYNPGQVPIDSTEKYNTEMELSFDFNNNELVISSPIDSYTNELRLIFSFSKKNWRAEKYSLSYTDDTITATIKTSTALHKVKFNNPKLVHTNVISASDLPSVPGTTDKDKEVNFSQQDINLEHDEANWNERTTNVQNDIQGEIYTHEAGDGKNDFNMHSAIVECIPTIDIFDPGYTPQLTDPEFSYERRNTDNATDVNYPILESEPVVGNTNDTFTKWFNMFYHNLRTRGATDAFQSNLQTPNDNTGEQFGSSTIIKNPSRESFILLAPLNSIFRRIRFRFISTLVKKVRSFEIRIVPHKRKSL